MPESLKQKTFSYKEAQELGINQYQLEALLKKGLIEKTGYGQYRDTALMHDPEADYYMASKAVGNPSAICLISALVYYQLTDAIPKQVWVLVPQEVRRRHPRLRLVRKRDPQWKIGINQEKGYSITSLERSIVESLVLHRLIGKNEALGALKRALKSKKTTIQKLYSVARAMGEESKVQAYLEALAP